MIGPSFNIDDDTYMNGKNGMAFFWMSTLNNAPSGTMPYSVNKFGYLIWCGAEKSYNVQVFIPFDEGEVKVRTTANNKWYDWRTI